MPLSQHVSNLDRQSTYQKRRTTLPRSRWYKMCIYYEGFTSATFNPRRLEDTNTSIVICTSCGARVGLVFLGYCEEKLRYNAARSNRFSWQVCPAGWPTATGLCSSCKQRDEQDRGRRILGPLNSNSRINPAYGR